jgi:hypothetical protein
MPAFVARQMAAVAERSAPRHVTGAGEYRGAAYCGDCHPRQLAEWRGSLHAKATTEAVYAPRYEELSWAMPLKECDGCHAPTPWRAEGVTCEGCHGPGRTERVARDICLGCHQITALNPIMEPLSTGREFEASAAHAAGQGCVDCHMRQSGGRTFHGFPGSRTAPEVYRGVVAIQSVERKGDKLAVTVRNHVAGHFLPTGAPENVIFLTVAGFDPQGRSLFTREYRFEKRMFRFRHMPMLTVADTRLKDGEMRTLDIPAPTAARVEVALIIRPILWNGKQVEQVLDRHEEAWH